jgi:baculoviral IAP repeat-containing protein 6
MSCSHAEEKLASLVGVILGHQQVMAALLQSLSICHGGLSKHSTLNAMIADQLLSVDPVSVGDGVFQILCTLNQKASSLPLLLQPLYQFLAADFRGVRMTGASRLSEPLLLFALRVLDCPNAIGTFLEMGKLLLVDSLWRLMVLLQVVWTSFAKTWSAVIVA